MKWLSVKTLNFKQVKIFHFQMDSDPVYEAEAFCHRMCCYIREDRQCPNCELVMAELIGLFCNCKGLQTTGTYS